LERTRIVLIDAAPLLREILREIIMHEPDLALVAEHEAVVDVRKTVERDAADFVVVGRDAASADDVRAMVGAGLGVRALEVYSDGKESVLYELRPHRVRLGEISSDTLLGTIRAVPGWDVDAATDETSERRTV
jgi:DNA-binding NarL/FixJ family response regulator